MKVVLLGTAAGGGFPQWNCACEMCTAARAGDPAAPVRTQDCVAVSADGQRWYLLNASPDIRTQLLSCDLLAAGPGTRQTPVRGVLLTDAELDHCLGLAVLREGSGLQIGAPRAVTHSVTEHLGLRSALDTYAAWNWAPAPETPVGGLRVTELALSDKRPRYAAGCQFPGPWAVAYRIADQVTGGVLLYAPCVAAWTDQIAEAVDTADCVLLDGTFYDPDEMSSSVRPAVGSRLSQHSMGHLPIGGAEGSLRQLRMFPHTRLVYTHLNNTNPALHAESEQRRAIVEAGVELLPDGTVIEL